MYKLVVGGITASIHSTTAYIPTAVWSNVIVETEDIKNDVQYLYGVVDGGTTSPTKVIDNSILSILMTKQSGGDTSDFDNSTDSLEATSDKIGAFTGDGGTDYNDSILAGLQVLSKYIADGDGDFATGSVLPANKSLYDLLGAYLDAGGGFGTDNVAADLLTIVTDTEKIYDAALGAAPVAGSLTTFVAGGAAAALGTQLPVSTSLYDTTKNVSMVGVTAAPVANTLADILHKDGSFTFDNTTDSLEAISDAVTSGTFVVVADSGTTSLVVDATYGTYGNDYFNGNLLVCTSGTNVGQSRVVIDFATTSGTFTISPPFAGAVVTTDTFSLISGWRTPEWAPWQAVPINTTAVVSPGVDVIDLKDTDLKETYRLNNVRFKLADPGANTVTITLSELINDVATAVDTFTVTTDNYTDYHSLMDMFGIPQITGDAILINATTSAGSYALIGQYQYDISYNA
jgi:hypothetical protein